MMLIAQIAAALCALIGFLTLLVAQSLFDQLRDQVHRESPPHLRDLRIMHPGVHWIVHDLHKKKYPDDEARRRRETRLSAIGGLLVLVGFLVLAIASAVPE